MRYLGTITATYNELAALFGKPGRGDEYKTEASWDTMLTDGDPVLVYNYKNSRSYSTDYPSIYEITEWNVQGNHNGVLEKIEGIVSQIRKELEDEPPAIKYPGIKVNLKSADGSKHIMFALCLRAAHKAGLSDKTVNEFITEATLFEYNDLEEVCQRWFACA